MARRPQGDLRTGWTTGTCATAATKAALQALETGTMPHSVSVVLPRGETTCQFPIAHNQIGAGYAEAGIVKDAGDDPDVTHGAMVIVRAELTNPGTGVVFKAGKGVGTVTKPGLPVPPGEPAINPVPRQMMTAEVEASGFNDVCLIVSIPGGDTIAKQTWNPRLGIEGGLSILGTTGIVRPFSCAAWIASIHRGIDVARAAGLDHVAGTTGATSERAVQERFALPDHAMLDMGDFAGGMLKYLARHPVKRLTIGGGFAKMTKLAQGALDLHSDRSQVDFAALAALATSDGENIRNANTALEALTLCPNLAAPIARLAQATASAMAPDISIDTVIVSRSGNVLATSA